MKLPHTNLVFCVHKANGIMKIAREDFSGLASDMITQRHTMSRNSLHRAECYVGSGSFVFPTNWFASLMEVKACVGEKMKLKSCCG